jgi:hypothetical protein
MKALPSDGLGNVTVDGVITIIPGFGEYQLAGDYCGRGCAD